MNLISWTPVLWPTVFTCRPTLLVAPGITLGGNFHFVSFSKLQNITWFSNYHRDMFKNATDLSISMVMDHYNQANLKTRISGTIGKIWLHTVSKLKTFKMWLLSLHLKISFVRVVSAASMNKPSLFVQYKFDEILLPSQSFYQGCNANKKGVGTLKKN